MTNSHPSGSSLIEKLTTALIGTVIATLAGAVLWSGNYLLHVCENLDAEMTKVQQAFNEEQLRSNRGSQFLTAVSDAMKRSASRVDRSDEFLKSAQKQQITNEYDEWTQEAILESTQDLGLLSGFTSETTGLPESYHQSVINLFKTEISLYRVQDDLMKSFGKGKKPPASIWIEYQAQRAEREYAQSLFKSSFEDMTVERNFQLQKDKEIFDAAHSQLQNYRKWGHLAIVTLGLSVLGFYIMGRIVFARKHVRSAA
jgi:hypothetical protein